MCQHLLKKLLFILVLLSGFSVSVFAQDDLPDLDELNEIAMELSNESTILEMQQLQQELASKMELILSTADSLSQTLPSEISMELQSLISNCNPKLMSLSELLKLIKTLYNWQTQQSTTYSTLVSDGLSSMKSLSDQLSNCLELANKALLSNKADTENAIELFGLAQEQIEIISNEKEQLKKEWAMHLELDAEKDKRLQNSYIAGSVLSSLPGIALITTGLVYLSNIDDQIKLQQGWQYITYGAVSLVGFELVYQGGHWLFRWW